MAIEARNLFVCCRDCQEKNCLKTLVLSAELMTSFDPWPFAGLVAGDGAGVTAQRADRGVLVKSLWCPTMDGE